jgi:glyoxylase-like metal-dependent hydrolase (beta-lactamase superfamily II)
MIVNQSFGHEINISDQLILYRLSEQSYVHSQKNNNGLVYINHGEAIIVSTPNSDIETQNLIDWVRNEKHSKIVGYIIDRWHPDAMEGLDVVHKNGINSYAYELTRHIAKVKGLPVPKIGFNPKQVIEVGKEKIICHFLGEAHTIDGIVVWIPSENILFGGNEIRNYHGWVGNIGDANLDKWSDTATNIKKKYGSAKIVIPGHGKYGGSELIDYTIALYKLPRSNLGANSPKELPNNDLKTHSDFFYKAESESLQDGKRILKNAHLTIQDTTKYVEIESPHIVFQPDNKRVKSEIGRLKIYDKKSKSVVLRTDVNYKKMIVFKVDNSVGLAVILKEITNNNR